MAADRVVHVRSVESGDADTIDLIAQRMRLTLAEVLGEDRADAMFDHAALVARVEWHLDRTVVERQADVFVAIVDDEIVGHTMVRVDEVEGEQLGLFATIYVTPSARRWGVASSLVQAGESWMRRREMAIAATFTDAHNERLLRFFDAHGYECAQVDEEWATARRSLC